MTAVGAAAAVALVLAGCSVDGEPTSDVAGKAASSGAAEPSVDVSALDTGTYPTDPRPPFGTATQENILQIEGQRMAQFIVVPFEVDEDLTKAGMPTMVITGPSNVRLVLDRSAADVPANKAMVGGYVATASTPPESLRAGTKRALNNMVVRYLTPADATAAAKQMADATAANTKGRIGTLPGLPGTITVSHDSTDGKVLMAFTPRNNYVLYQWYETTPAQQDRLEPTIRTAVEKQSALIDKFPATPTKAEAAARGITGPTRPQMDQNHVLIYALPYSEEELKNPQSGIPRGSIQAVYGPRGMAHQSSDPVTDFNVLTEVGSTANAVDKSTVYRASTPEGATKIVDTFLASNRNAGWTDAGSPPGLPSAKCQTNSTVFFCIVQKGRYVGSVSAREKKDAFQQISAQYVIFTKADQNAN